MSLDVVKGGSLRALCILCSNPQIILDSAHSRCISEIGTGIKAETSF